MDNNNIVSLKINGVAYAGWLSVDISSNLTGLARTFKVSATRKNSNDGISVPFEPGDEVQVMVDSNKIITGYVEKVEVSYSATSLSIEVSGSSKTIDLVQCQIPLGNPHSWKNVAVSKILSDLAGYYGISVIDKVGLKNQDTLEVPPNKKVGDAITELLKKHSILITDNADGNLVIYSRDKAESSTDALELSKNIYNGKRSIDVTDVFSHYVVLGQAKNAGSTQTVKSNQLKSTIVTNEDCRTRWSVQTMSGAARQDLLNKKASLQHNYSVGSSDSYTYVVQGWRQSNGDLWEVGRSVIIRDSFVTLPDESAQNATDGTDAIQMLIARVSYKISASGTTCEIECKDIDAFLNTEIEVPTKAKKAKNAGKKKKGKGKKKGKKGTKVDLSGIQSGSGRTNTTGNWS